MMTEQTDMEARAAEIKRQLEALTGHEIAAHPDQLIKFWFPMSVESFDSEPGAVLWNSIFGWSRCVANRIMDVSGASVTGSDGQCVFLLSEFTCNLGGYRLYDPINVVATPRVNTPCFITLTHGLTTQGGATDVKIRAFTWMTDGTPAPSIPFDWRCRVVAERS